MTVSLRLNDDDSELIRAYADMNGISVSELFRQFVLERIENELDLKAYEKAMAEYIADPVTYPLEDRENSYSWNRSQKKYLQTLNTGKTGGQPYDRPPDFLFSGEYFPEFFNCLVVVSEYIDFLV